MSSSLGWAFTLFMLTVYVTVRADISAPAKLLGMNPCISKQTCHDCIRTPECVWCSAPDFREPRCFLPKTNTKISAACGNYTWTPKNTFNMVRHAQLTKGYSSIEGSSSASSSSSSSASSSSSSSSSGSMSGSSSQSGKQEAIQIWPQEVNLQLRINEAYRMAFHYSQAEDYPVDLYYLMDLSKSMEDDKTKLSDLGELLVESMSKLTRNFRLGFGSFVDKVVMPYVSVVPKALEEPCTKCAKPYGYKNIMKLSQNTSVFADLVRNASVSGNLDAPEGGFDAIMQAIVCFDDIGWRDKARKLLVFSTDAGFHYAGDGKLGGIVKPNDGLCHLDHTGLYTQSSLQDYPSISQINLKVKEKTINIIWAVTEGQINIYKRLTKHIEGSFAGKLSEDSSNVVELIKEQYAAITSSIEITDTARSGIQVKYFSRCTGAILTETSKCEGLKVGTVVKFIAEVSVTKCPENRTEWNQTFSIRPVGINESLTVNLQMLCDCDCEHSSHPMYEENSPQCNSVGTLKCGVCDCIEGRFGKKCECPRHDVRVDSNIGFNNNQGCRAVNDSRVDCSGRGTCSCGVCECDKRANKDELITGSYCECDNFSCDRHEGLLCSNHGTCECRQCVCDPDWTGTACNCPSSNRNCIPPGSTNGTVCSGFGTCECGECICSDDKGSRRSGKYCEKCPSCPNRCEEFTSCVECQVYSTGNYSKGSDCEKYCTEFKAEEVELVTAEVQDEETFCHYIDENDCLVKFFYYYNQTTNLLVVKAQKEKECPQPVYVLGIVLGVIAAIVLIGMALLLLWKLLTTIHDRREFARFEKERMMAKWDTGENPIYKQATSTFKNPTYVGK